MGKGTRDGGAVVRAIGTKSHMVRVGQSVGDVVAWLVADAITKVLERLRACVTGGYVGSTT